MNIFTLILLNTAFFFCNIYPKHIVELNNLLSAVAMLLNLLFYVAFSLLLLQAFRKRRDPFGGNLFSPFKKGNRMTELMRIILILAVQILLDLVLILLEPALNESVYYAADLFTVVSWVIFYFICATKESSIFRRGKVWLPVVVLVLLFGGAACGNYRLWADFTSISEQYYVTAEAVMQAARNTEFLFELKNFILDTLCGSFLLGAHYFLNRPKVKKKSSAGELFVRGIVVLLCVWAAVAVKYWVHPDSCMNKTEGQSSSHLNYEASDNPFSSKTSTWTTTRFGSGNPVYQISNTELSYQGSVLLEYDSVIRAVRFDKKTTGEMSFFLYGEQAICFVLDGEPILIHANEAPGPASEALTSIYKSLIGENNWLFFKQGAEYLFEHDRAFIVPYLERYAAAEFTEAETASLAEIFMKHSYIRDVSIALIES